MPPRHTPSRRRDDWGTPDWLFDRLHLEFDFTLDACAEPHNAKLPLFLEDCLTEEPWPGAPGAAFLNPPYAKELLDPILERSALESFRRPVVALLPVRTDMAWWHTRVLPSAAELRFILGRIAFVPPRGHAEPFHNRPAYASVVVVWRPGVETGRRPLVRTLKAPRNRRGETWT